MILRIISSILGTFLVCFLFPFLSSYLGIMFQVEVGGEVLGKGIGLTWDEAKMQVIYLSSFNFCLHVALILSKYDI